MGKERERINRKEAKTKEREEGIIKEKKVWKEQ